MGQVRNVMVHRLLCLDSIDERIVEILEDKQRIFDAFADESLAAKEGFGIEEKEYSNIIEKEIERINARRDANVAGVLIETNVAKATSISDGKGSFVADSGKGPSAAFSDEMSHIEKTVSSQRRGWFKEHFEGRVGYAAD